MDSDTYSLMGAVALIFTFIVVLPVLTFRFEKHMVWRFGEPEAEPRQRHPYTESWVAAATHAGFSFLGWARDLRGGIYQVNHALLVSPDRTTMAVITAGALIIPIEGTCLYTPTADGRTFFTINSPYFAEYDLSRNWTHQFALGLSFQGLCRRHQAWLQEAGVVPRPFASGRELEGFRAVCAEHYQLMAHRGLISYTDASATCWKYTLNGAIRTAMRSFRVALMRKFTVGRFPRTA